MRCAGRTTSCPSWSTSRRNRKRRCCAGGELARGKENWEGVDVKTITLEEIYADPHVLDPLLAATEPVEIVCLEERIATLTPSPRDSKARTPKPFDLEAHRAWF